MGLAERGSWSSHLKDVDLIIERVELNSQSEVPMSEQLKPKGVPIVGNSKM